MVIVQKQVCKKDVSYSDKVNQRYKHERIANVSLRHDSNRSFSMLLSSRLRQGNLRTENTFLSRKRHGCLCSSSKRDATLETIFGDEDLAESIGWEGTYIGRIWQFMREINIQIKGPNTKRSKGDNFTTTANTKDRWELDLIGRARKIWWKHQVRAPSVGHTYAEYWDWPTPFSTTMTPRA